MPGRSPKQVINDSELNILAEILRLSKMGTHLSGIAVQARVVVASNTTALGEQLRVAHLLRAYVTVGGVTGLKTIVAGAPATGEVSTNAFGQIIFAGADAVTEAEVIYVPLTGDIIDAVVNTNGAGLGTLPGGKAGKFLLSAEVLSGASVGVKTVIARGGAPAAGEAALSVSGKGVQFNAAAANSPARVRYIESPAAGKATSELLVTDQSTI